MEKVYICILLVGLVLTGYYGFQWWQSSQATETVSLAETEGWSKTDLKVTTESIQSNLNKSDKNVQVSPVVMSEDMNQYQPGEEVGRLVIPSIEKGFPTYWGADEATLDQGVGMYVSQWTATPDHERHTVLSGHRNTVFAGLEEIKKGDTLFLEYEGQRFEYAVEDMWVTDAEDRTVIVDKNEATLTLTTCYPFDFIGHASQRYIIQGNLIEVQDM